MKDYNQKQNDEADTKYFLMFLLGIVFGFVFSLMDF